MLSRVNSMSWIDGNKGESEENSSWIASQNNNNGVSLFENNDEMEMETFRSMLEAENDDWYMANQDISFSHGFSKTAGNSNVVVNNKNNNYNINNNNHQLLLQQLDSSAFGSPSPASIFTNQLNTCWQQKPFVSAIPNNLPEARFGLGRESSGYVRCAFNRNGSLSYEINAQNRTINLNQSDQFGNGNNSLLHFPQGSGGFEFGESSMQENNLFNGSNSKTLKPLDNFVGSLSTQPTLFQKRALRNNSGGSFDSLNLIGGGLNYTILKSTGSASTEQLFGKKEDFGKRKRKSNVDDIEELSIEGSNPNYDYDEQFLDDGKVEESCKNGGTSSRGNGAGEDGDGNGKKKKLPAKNLMAERRRRKKLNDRLYMLRSVVPNISKMDRVSIVGDAIEYLKELLQKINDLNTKLESIPSGSTLFPTTSLNPLTPSTRIKEELCSSAFTTALSSPTAQPTRVEVRLCEGRAVNIHMFCGHRPGHLLSTMRAMEDLGLDVQQAVISCFNGFALDVFRAEQCREGHDLNPDQIKAALLDSTGYCGMV